MFHTSKNTQISPCAALKYQCVCVLLPHVPPSSYTAMHQGVQIFYYSNTRAFCYRCSHGSRGGGGGAPKQKCSLPPGFSPLPSAPPPFNAPFCQSHSSASQEVLAKEHLGTACQQPKQLEGDTRWESSELSS